MQVLKILAWDAISKTEPSIGFGCLAHNRRAECQKYSAPETSGADFIENLFESLRTHAGGRVCLWKYKVI